MAVASPATWPIGRLPGQSPGSVDDPACILPGATVPRAPDRAEAFAPDSAGHSAHGLLGPSSTGISGTQAHSHPAGRNPGKNLPWGKGIGGGHVPSGGNSSREALGPYSPAFCGSMELHVVVWVSRHYQLPFPSELLVSGPTRLPLPLVAMTLQGPVEPATDAEFNTHAPPFSAPPWPTFGNGEGLSPPPPSSDPRPLKKVRVVSQAQTPVLEARHHGIERVLLCRSHCSS